MSSAMLQFTVPAFFLINAWTMFRFWQDKVRAVNGGRRIPEANLLWFALIGGTLGAFLGRHISRHKTRKEPFSTYLQIILVMQIGGIIGDSHDRTAPDYAGRNGIAAAASLWSPVKGSGINMGTAG